MTDDRIAALEAKLNAAQAELAVLKGKSGKADLDAMPVSMAFTNAPEKREVRITPILTEAPSLPNLREMEKLYAAVRGLSPWPEALVDRYDETRPSRGFNSALRWVQSMRRSDRPNSRVALSYWVDCCKNWLRDRGSITGDLSANALVLAVFAAGDVCYCPANSQLGVVWEFGLLEYGGRAAAPDAWRRVMREGAGAILPPSAPARRTPAPSNVRVVVGY